MYIESYFIMYVYLNKVTNYTTVAVAKHFLFKISISCSLADIFFYDLQEHEKKH